MAHSTLQRYRITYRGFSSIDMHISAEEYLAAQEGDSSAQAYIMADYVTKLADRHHNEANAVQYDWEHFQIASLENDAFPDVGQGGCGCECNPCDIGYHCRQDATGCKV
jgi:hypothetical protein